MTKFAADHQRGINPSGAGGEGGPFLVGKLADRELSSAYLPTARCETTKSCSWHALHSPANCC